MLDQLQGAVNENTQLVRRGRLVNLEIQITIGDDDHIVSIENGRIAGHRPRRLALESGVFCLSATTEVWREHWAALPKRDYHDLFSMLSSGKAHISGDLKPLMQHLLYFKELFAAPRPPAPEAAARPAPAAGELKYEPIVGRYAEMTLAGETSRVYIEEAGSGIPLVCLHTAGSDGRQFRHLMCNPAITAHYRVIAFDLPWHGKSNPPAAWQNQSYELSTDRYLAIVEDFCAALGLDNPVLIGCSMGGRIVLHLALARPDDYRAVIALEGADRLAPYYDTDWLHRGDVHGGEISAGYVSGQVAPQSPAEYRWETLWAYMQSGPGIFKGDLYFYWQDGHFDDRSGQIDTARCPVYLLSGEYDNSCTPERMLATAERIKGSKAVVMEGLGHFPMSENPERFAQHIVPVLDEIRGVG